MVSIRIDVVIYLLMLHVSNRYHSFTWHICVLCVCAPNNEVFLFEDQTDIYLHIMPNLHSEMYLLLQDKKKRKTLSRTKVSLIGRITPKTVLI